MFTVIHGILEKDTRKLVSGIPQLKGMFKLPKKVDALLSLATVMLTRSNANMEEIVQQFCSVFNIDATFIVGLVQLSKRDYSKIAQFAERFSQCNPEVINKFISLLTQLGMLGPTKNSPGSLKILQGAGGGQPGNPASNLSNLSYKELFQMFDQVCFLVACAVF